MLVMQSTSVQNRLHADGEGGDLDTVLSMYPDARDGKQNTYFRRKLIEREFLVDDLMKVSFELPVGTSLQSLGFDVGLGDFIRMRPFSEEHMKVVAHPFGGRAYTPRAR